MDARGRGRPAATRARVMNYWAKHGPCSIMQIVRATGADRKHVQRMLRVHVPEFQPKAGRPIAC